ncbi:uncharacterized protein LOC130649402 [Hydractinia symbiolongicarpus]|uniref:uncharacterized protein LOC130649402 n=1 Tax=Hydractinia symbiolongicarpus TaxID=13093 RepID=UPI00254C3021|nr:uncharacterized protein LOC130649402 [Hydractinia symbiolongicarpus]
MRILALAFSIFCLSSFYVKGDDATSNPCDGGELFSLVCKMLTIMKRNTATARKHLEAKFVAVEKEQKNVTLQVQKKFRKESEKLLQKHDSDVKALVKLIETKVQTVTKILDKKMSENKKTMDERLTMIWGVTQSNLSRLETKIVKQINNSMVLNSKNFNKLESEIVDNKNDLTEKLKLEKAEMNARVNTKYENIKNECQKKITSVQHQMTTQIQKNQQQIQNLLTKYKQTSNWPSGSYCILQNGACPAGFRSIMGHMIALSMYAATSTYIKPVAFGNSRISCHGRCGQYPNYFGELHISACCK